MIGDINPEVGNGFAAHFPRIPSAFSKYPLLNTSRVCGLQQPACIPSQSGLDALGFWA